LAAVVLRAEKIDGFRIVGAGLVLRSMAVTVTVTGVPVVRRIEEP